MGCPEDQQAILCRHRSERRGPPRVHIEPMRPCSSEWVRPRSRWRNFARRLVGIVRRDTSRCSTLQSVWPQERQGQILMNWTGRAMPWPAIWSTRRQGASRRSSWPKLSTKRRQGGERRPSGERWHRAGRGSWSWIVRQTFMVDRGRSAGGSPAGIAIACWSSSKLSIAEAANSRARDRQAMRWAPKSGFRPSIPHSRKCRSMPTRHSRPSGDAGKATTRVGPT